MSKLRHLIWCITFFSISTNAKFADSAYYSNDFISKINSSSSNSSTIKEELFKLLQKTHQPVENYKKARELLFGQIDLKYSPVDNSTYLVDRYCDYVAGKEDGVGENKIPNPNIINCEHTWPQSKFTKNFSEQTQKNDLHHLFAVLSRANSSRSNLPFGEVDGKIVANDCSQSYRGVLLNNPTIKAFEPNEVHKGNVARALFYFSIRYKIAIDDYQEEYLRQWHKDDPVDTAELQRNDKVYDVQFNRNPFVDEPSLADKITNF